jgi:N-acetylneuraminic acid mutarotase
MHTSIKGSIPRAYRGGLLALGLVLHACTEQQQNPLAVDSTASTPASTVSRASPADKKSNAVDLGSPSLLNRALFSTSSVSAFGATTTAIPYDPEPGPFTHQVACGDDCVQAGLPIGFTFSFFGNRYTTFAVSSNGFIGFTPPEMSNGCCSGRPIPSADFTNNVIAAAWTDLYPPGGGGVFYETRGRAPNRYLIVAFQDLPWYPESFTNRVTTQIILYEGTNLIEIHTANQSAGHIYTQGVENATGTEALFVPGRVAANYGLTNDAVRWNLGNFWSTVSPLPSPRRAFAMSPANGLLFAIGGLNSAGTALTSTIAYNPTTNAWTTKAALPAARRTGNGAASINNIIYLAGGSNAAGALTRSLFAYNPSANTWITKANLPVVSGCGGSAAIGGKLYVFTGCTVSSSGQQVPAGLLHRYDPSNNSWTTLHAAPAVHFQPALGVISGKLYVAGGNNAAGTATGRLDVYDPATNTWSSRASMPTARVAMSGAVVGGRLHVVGGRNAQTYSGRVEAYDPATDSWSIRSEMPTARAAFGLGTTAQLVYVFGGNSGAGVLATGERYTP